MFIIYLIRNKLNDLVVGYDMNSKTLSIQNYNEKNAGETSAILVTAMLKELK